MLAPVVGSCSLTTAPVAARRTPAGYRRRGSAPRPLAAAGSSWSNQAGASAGAKGSDSQQLSLEDIIDKAAVPTGTGLAANILTDPIRRLLSGGGKNGGSSNNNMEQQLHMALRAIAAQAKAAEHLAETVARQAEQLAEARRQRDVALQRLQEAKAELAQSDGAGASKGAPPFEDQLQD